MSLDTDRTRSLEREGIQAARVWWNLSQAALYEESVRRREGLIAANGPLVCRTGPHTGRSPNDKFIVKEPSSDRHIAWGGAEPADRSGGVRDASARPDRVASSERRVRARLLRRRRSGSSRSRSA